MTLLDLTIPSLETRSLDHLPVAIVGAGPIGLAAAANLVERGIDFVVYESGEVASSIRKWGHTRLFSPWRHVVDPASRRLLEAAGWEASAPEALPTDVPRRPAMHPRRRRSTAPPRPPVRETPTTTTRAISPWSW